MKLFWWLLLVIFALAPLIAPMCGFCSWRKWITRSHIQAFDDLVPQRHRAVVALAFFVLILFVAAKVKGLL